MKASLTVSVDYDVLTEAREVLDNISFTVEMLLRKEIVRIKKKGKK